MFWIAASILSLHNKIYYTKAHRSKDCKGMLNQTLSNPLEDSNEQTLLETCCKHIDLTVSDSTWLKPSTSMFERITFEDFLQSLCNRGAIESASKITRVLFIHFPSALAWKCNTYTHCHKAPCVLKLLIRISNNYVQDQASISKWLISFYSFLEPRVLEEKGIHSQACFVQNISAIVS